MKRSLFAGLLALGMAVLDPAAAQDHVTIFAAASLKNAMDEVVEAWRADTGHKAVVSLAGSSALARQIEQGAPADIFISANSDWMDRLEEGGLIDAETRFDLLTNSIVLVATGTDAPAVEIEPDFDLAGMLGEEKLAMALVDAVPAGIYGKIALESLDVWEKVRPKVAQADNVRAALALVSAGEAPYGVVYATDAAADDNVTVVGTFPAETHPPIVYPAAAVADSESPLTEEFLAFLCGPAAREAFERQGFGLAADD